MKPIANFQPNPTHPNPTPGSRTRGGISRDRAETVERPRGSKPGAEERPPLSEQLAAEFTWAEQHLPKEHAGFVVSAMCSLRFAGVAVSTKTVMARLEATGRDREAVNVLARRYGTKELP